MRLDVFLVTSRLVKRRSLAQELCESGQVSISGSAGKSSKDVKIDDTITIRRGSGIMTVRVIRIPAGKQIAKADASSLFETIRIDKIDEDTV